MTSRLLALVVVLLLALAACGTDTTTPPDEAPVDPPAAGVPDNGSADDPDESDQSDEYVPQVPVPDGLPVYPGAVLTNEISAGDQGWQWLYQTTGSGNEIVAFFTDALQDLGFGIDTDATLAMHEEFFVVTADRVVQVYWLDPGMDGVDPDTPNRGYAIVVDPDTWDSR